MSSCAAQMLTCTRPARTGAGARTTGALTGTCGAPRAMTAGAQPCRAPARAAAGADDAAGSTAMPALFGMACYGAQGVKDTTDHTKPHSGEKCWEASPPA